jgi:hypothetical protein
MKIQHHIHMEEQPGVEQSEVIFGTVVFKADFEAVFEDCRSREIHQQVDCQLKVEFRVLKSQIVGRRSLQ